MTETDHVTHKYRGTAGETVTITVTTGKPNNLLATYNLRGAGHVPFPASGTLQFQLVAGSNRLELLLDCKDNNDSDIFHVVARSVQNETNNECVDDFNYHGIPQGPEYLFTV